MTPDDDAAPTPNLPQARQCADPKHALFGAVAVRADNDRWGVMHPANGGHWATDEDVDAWPVLATTDA